MRIIELPFDPTAADVAGLRSALATVREVMATTIARGDHVRPTIVVTPFGLRNGVDLTRGLADLGVTVAARRGIRRWATLSSLLQVTWDDSLEKAVAFEALWRHLYPEDEAECWELATAADFARYHAAKIAMRAELGAEHVRVVTPRFCFRAKLHPFHSPEPARVAAESAWLDAAVPTRTGG